MRYGESGCVEGLVGSGEVDLKGVEFSAVTGEGRRATGGEVCCTHSQRRKKRSTS